MKKYQIWLSALNATFGLSVCVMQILCLTLVLGAAANAQSSIALGQNSNKPGNVFLTSDTVSIPTTSTGADHISYTVTDYMNVTVAAAVIPVGNPIIPSLTGRRGWFDLKASALSNGQVVAGPVETNFAVVTPSNISWNTPEPFGVCTHLASWAYYGASIPIIDSLISLDGINGVRDDVSWDNTETAYAGQGNYDWSWSDTYMPQLSRDLISPYIIFSGGGPAANYWYDYIPVLDGNNNPVYETNPNGTFILDHNGNKIPEHTLQTPYDSSGYTGFANSCAAAVNYYRSQISEVEIWNEYNGGTWVTGPAADSNYAPTGPGHKEYYYTQLLKSAGPAIKNANPSATIVGGVTIGPVLPYVKYLGDDGAFSSMDRFSFHDYRNMPEGAESDIANLRSMMSNYANGASMPINVSETGWIPAAPKAPGLFALSESDEAKCLVRELALMLSAQATEIYWYDFLDDGGYDTGMGLMRGWGDPLGAYVPKPAYVAMANVTRQLGTATFVKKETTGHDIYSELFHNTSGQNLHVMWTTIQNGAAITLNDSAHTVTCTDIMGNATTLSPVSGKINLTVTTSPVYILDVPGNYATLATPPTQPTVLADAVKDYPITATAAQPNKGWYYGYFVSGSTPGAYNPANFVPISSSSYGANPGDYYYCWQGPSQWLMDAAGQMAPDTPNGSQSWAVERWVSTVSGTVEINGSFMQDSTSGGDGVDAHVYVDGREIVSQRLYCGSGQYAIWCGVPFDLVVNVNVGSKVDFVVDPGPGLDSSFDTSSLCAKILSPGTTLLPQTGWIATASSSASGTTPSMAIDGNLDTLWQSGVGGSGQWFEIQLPAKKSFSKITLAIKGYAGSSTASTDYPWGYKAMVSSDNVNWNTVATGTGTPSTTTVTFPTQSAKYVKIVQTGGSPYWWSIGEVNLFQ